MSLVRAELRRLFKRRVTVWMLVAGVLVLGAVVIGVAASNQKIGPEAYADAQAQAQADYEEQLRWYNESIDDQIAQCEDDLAAGRNENWPPDFDCQELREWGPQPEHYEAEWYLPETFHFRQDFRDMIFAFTGVLALIGFVVGASFVGAEWRSGGMMNLLLWRPRRLQVLGAKLGTLLGGLLGIGLVLGGLWTAAFWLVATYRGITDTMTGGAWQSLALTGVRGLVLVLAAAAVGFAIASVGRHTAAAMGAAVAAVVVGLVGVLIVVGTIGLAYPEAWLWSTYLAAWMQQSVTAYNYDSCNFVQGACEPETLVITWQASGLGLGVLVVLLVGAAVWQMRRRDVT